MTSDSRLVYITRDKKEPPSIKSLFQRKGSAIVEEPSLQPRFIHNGIARNHRGGLVSKSSEQERKREREREEGRKKERTVNDFVRIVFSLARPPPPYFVPVVSAGKHTSLGDPLSVVSERWQTMHFTL